MGHEPTRSWKCLYFHFAGCLLGLFLLTAIGCHTGRPMASRSDPTSRAAQRLAHGENMLREGDYQAAREVSQTLLNVFSGQVDDRALYLLGMTWVHPGNPEQDTQQAATCFRRIVEQHPDSTLVAAAQTWCAVITRMQACEGEKAAMETTSVALQQRLKSEKAKRHRIEERLQQMKAIDLNLE